MCVNEYKFGGGKSRGNKKNLEENCCCMASGKWNLGLFCKKKMPSLCLKIKNQTIFHLRPLAAGHNKGGKQKNELLPKFRKKAQNEGKERRREGGAHPQDTTFDPPPPLHLMGRSVWYGFRCHRLPGPGHLLPLLFDLIGGAVAVRRRRAVARRVPRRGLVVLWPRAPAGPGGGQAPTMGLGADGSTERVDRVDCLDQKPPA